MLTMVSRRCSQISIISNSITVFTFCVESRETGSIELVRSDLELTTVPWCMTVLEVNPGHCTKFTSRVVYMTVLHLEWIVILSDSYLLNWYSCLCPGSVGDVTLKCYSHLITENQQLYQIILSKLHCMPLYLFSLNIMWFWCTLETGIVNSSLDRVSGFIPPFSLVIIPHVTFPGISVGRHGNWSGITWYPGFVCSDRPHRSLGRRLLLLLPDPFSFCHA